MSLHLIYQTLGIVLVLTFSFGPAFFALINTGIKYGYKTGSLLALGVVLSDFIVCLLIIFGASNFVPDDKSQRFIGILAGVVLIVFGALHFRHPAPKSDDVFVLTKPSATYLITKGFLLNSLNPAVWLLWLSNVTVVSKPLGYSVIKMTIYFSITLALVLLVELAKVAASDKLKKVLTPKIMYIINIITGVLLVIFGLVLIYTHYFDEV